MPGQVDLSLLEIWHNNTSSVIFWGDALVWCRVLIVRLLFDRLLIGSQQVWDDSCCWGRCGPLSAQLGRPAHTVLWLAWNKGDVATL